MVGSSCMSKRMLHAGEKVGVHLHPWDPEHWALRIVALWAIPDYIRYSDLTLTY